MRRLSKQWDSLSSAGRTALWRCQLPRQLAIKIAVSFIVITCLLVMFNQSPTHDDDGMEYSVIIHGHSVGPDTEQLYPLTPFPSSPIESPRFGADEPTDNPLLVAVICAAGEVERRMMIRATWMDLYGHYPVDMRFVVSNPGPQWTDNVRLENRTYGDMIVLDHLQEDDVTANTIKTLEFYRWLLKQGRQYQFVSKTDTDVWLNLGGFWDRFIAPRLSNDTGTQLATVERTVIADLAYRKEAGLTYPLGSLYTVTWDMVELLPLLQDRYRLVTGEDMLIGVLMRKGGETANFVNFRGTEKFNYDPKDARQDGTPWARAASRPAGGRHALYGDQMIAVHEVKKADVFMAVAGCFNESGVKDMPPLPDPEPPGTWELWWHDVWWTWGLSNRYLSRFEIIPEHKWQKEEDGTWLCDGVWRTGHNKTGYQ